MQGLRECDDDDDYEDPGDPFGGYDEGDTSDAGDDATAGDGFVLVSGAGAGASGSLGARRSLDLAGSDGGSSIRRAMGMYGGLSARGRGGLY